MKYFLVKSIKLLSLLFVIWIVMFYINNTYHFNNFNKQNTTVILGDSHGKHGIKPYILSKNTSNYCQSAEPLNLTFYKMLKIDKNAQLDTLILTISTHSLSCFNDYKFTDDTWSNYMLDRSYSLILHQPIFFPIDKKKFYATIFKKMCIYPNIYHWEYTGSYEGIDNKNHHLNIEDFKNTLLRHYERNSTELSTSKIQLIYFNKIMNYCDSKNIVVVLVSSPVHSEYLAEVPERIINSYDSLVTAQKGRIIIDALRQPFNDTLFMNPDHLNADGAQVFSSMIKEVLSTKAVKMSAGDF